jgi:beta-phosphoglucomutase
MLRALLIDLDGTLVDSLPSLYRIYLEFLSSQGIQGNKDEFIELMGPSLSQIVDILRNRYHLKAGSSELLAKYNDLLEQCYAHNLTIMPGAVEVLSKNQAKGLKLVLATSAPRKWVDVLLNNKSLGLTFDASVTADDVHAGKPDPAIFLKGIELLGIQPNEALVIDDAPAGIEAARRAGIFALQFAPDVSDPSAYDDYYVVSNWTAIGEGLEW